MSFGMHIRLMLHYFQSGRPLPMGREPLQRIAGAQPRPQRAALVRVIERMWSEHPAGLVPAHAKLGLADDAQGGKPPRA